MSSANKPALTCRHCSASIGSQGVKLWDGNMYCRSCLEETLPGLAEYIESHYWLEETATYDRYSVVKRIALWYLLIGSPLASFMAWTGYQQRGMIGLLIGIAVPFVLVGIAALIQVPGFLRIIDRKLPAVRMHNGFLEVSWGRERVESRRGHLADIRWRIGKARQDSRLRWQPMGQKVILLEFLRTRVLGIPVKERVACGWTDEMFQIWQAFLTLANVKKVPGWRDR